MSPSPSPAPTVLSEAWPSVWMFAADGWANAGYTQVWIIALFLALGRSFAAFGGAMAFAAVVGAICGLVLGRYIDRGHGRKAVALAIGSALLCVVMRASGYGNPALAIAANATGALVAAFYTPTLMTAVYNLAKGSPCALRFHIATEAGWDVGGAAGMLAAAGLLTLGAPLWSAIGLAVFGTGAMFALMWRHYGTEAAPLDAPPLGELARSD